jgi:tetratricopeptide (TPR) repeat protein
LVETLQTTCLEQQKAILATAIFIRAGLCADNNRVAEADLLIKQCVDLREQILEPSDPDLGNTYYSAAIISMECDRHEESLDYHTKAIAVRDACGDDDHTQTAVAFQNLALLYVKTGKLDAAEEYLGKAVELCRSSSGADSDHYAECAEFQSLSCHRANIKCLESCSTWETCVLPKLNVPMH